MGIVGVRRRQPELPARELAEAQPGAFIATYWDPTANGGAGGWPYPPENGFKPGAGGRPIAFVAKLAPGFGQAGGGLQFQLVSSLVRGASSPLDVLWLINNGYLARAN